MAYYKSFRVVLGNPLWRRHLKWAYTAGWKDLCDLGVQPDVTGTIFSCLLCGVGNENTADEFIRFVLTKSPRAKIRIIDIGDEQIAAVKKLVAEKYSTADISVEKVNALHLGTIIPEESLDWIETDGFIEYFNHVSLGKLLDLWKKLLKPNGFITTRDFITNPPFTNIADAIRIWLAKEWLGVEVFRHTREELSGFFRYLGFKYAEGPTWLATFKRFTIVKVK